jgi:hypothetical protein
VRFRHGEEKLRTDDCRRIAYEVAELLGPQLPYVQSNHSFDAILDPTVFEAHPHLQEWIKSIDVYRNEGSYRGTLGWFNGSGFEWVGIKPEQVCHLIKAHDPSGYDMGDVDECWLVIYSTGRASFTARTRAMEQRSISSAHIAETVERSGFDRVYFWCREFKWTALLGSVGNPGCDELMSLG